MALSFHIWKLYEEEELVRSLFRYPKKDYERTDRFGRLQQLQESLGLEAPLLSNEHKREESKETPSSPSTPLTRSECDELTTMFLGEGSLSLRTLPEEWIKQVLFCCCSCFELDRRFVKPGTLLQQPGQRHFVWTHSTKGWALWSLVGCPGIRHQAAHGVWLSAASSLLPSRGDLEGIFEKRVGHHPGSG